MSTTETTPGRGAYEAVIGERDEARAELAKAGELIRRLERITTAWTLGWVLSVMDRMKVRQ